MIQNAEVEALKQVAERMALAARTAPKGRGKDLLAVAVLEGDDLARLADEMRRIGSERGSQTFLRDAENLRGVRVALLVGTRKQTMGLKVCGLCGFGDCAGCEGAGATCVFNPGDLGIALGSAVSVAADCRADNRIMYTIGLAALSLGLLGPDVKIAFGVPLSATGKNPFFDR
jgi:uncharacterized ferredoxin-like protein